jgi:uncharacterized NAD(P)/FAD-binding protein YdhS
MTTGMERPVHSRLTSCTSCESSRRPKIAIVGGGFSGTLVLAHLVATGSACDIELFEARADCGPGIAYGTCEAPHLLNVQAGRMGAFDADDFVRWLQSDQGFHASAQAGSKRLLEAADYAPRTLYARYLKDILARALDEAARRDIRVRVVRAAVTDMVLRKDNMMVVVAEGRRSEADFVVLATGNFPPRVPLALSRSAARSRRYVGDLWSAEKTLADRAQRLSNADTVLILGTGLTAVDAILSLRASGFDGKIVAMSRRGHLPLAHGNGARIPWTLTVPLDDVPPTARGYLAWLRREAKLAEADGLGWRSVLDAIRPHTQRLWQALDARERVKILRRLSLWNIHRHRMPPAMRTVLDALREIGQLEILAARCISIERRLGGFTVRFRRKGSDVRETLRPALVVNCVGPEYDVAHIDHPLFRSLLRRRLIVRAPAGGIAARDRGIAEGRNEGRIFAIGPLLIGELLETTAVPELRELAKYVANLVRTRLNVQIAARRP